MNKKEVKLIWSDVNLLSDVYNNFDYNGLYLHLYCLNGFNRIIYVGEGNISNRQRLYQNQFNRPDFNKFSCIDLNRINNDPYEIYTCHYDPTNNINRLNELGILFGHNDIIPNEIDILSIRRNYFNNLYISVVEYEDETERKQIERNLQKYFIDKWKILNYGTGNLIGLPNNLRNNIDYDLIINNYYDDIKLSDLPNIIELSYNS